MEESIFQPYIGSRPIFKTDRDILRPAFVPDRLPHREDQVDQLAQILSTALRGERPSNVLIGGRTVQYVYMNCEIVDTPYGVLQNVANRFVENLSQRIPFTGLSTDRVYQMLVEKLDEEKRIVILVLDEIDKIVTKNGDDLLYQLLKINDDLTRAKVSLIGISNDLKFTEWLDPRVKSRLSDEKMVFPPYNAGELFDILRERTLKAFDNGVAKDSVLSLISALAAAEHGDARRALDLLRVAAELAERAAEDHI